MTIISSCPNPARIIFVTWIFSFTLGASKPFEAPQRNVQIKFKFIFILIPLSEMPRVKGISRDCGDSVNNRGNVPYIHSYDRIDSNCVTNAWKTFPNSGYGSFFLYSE